jgi:hypothetical protein
MRFARRVTRCVENAPYELSEQECLAYFNATLAAIEIALDERLAELNRVKRLTAAKREISKVVSQIATTSTGV